MKSVQRRRSERGGFALRTMCVVVAAAFAETAASQTLPTGGTSAGATISTTGSAMTVTQSADRAIINWGSFGIGNGASVTFAQPGTTSIAVNRVSSTGGTSVINGTMNANGHVVILNGAGVLFGPTASVNVGGLIASTGNIDDDQFLGGGSFAITGAIRNAVRNEAKPTVSHPEYGITVANAGLVAFVAPSVSNSGTITAIGGRIRLASAQAATVTVSMNGGLYEFVVDQGVASGTLANTGTLTTGAAAGSIVLSALDAANVVSGAISLEGVQQANRIEVHGGQVVLKSDLDAAVVTGTSKTIEVCSCGQIQDGIDIAASGAAVNVGAGTFTQTKTLNVNKSVTLAGAGEASTIVDARTVSNNYGMLVNADHVWLKDFTFYGPAANVGNAYGIKVQPAGTTASSRLHDFKITNVTSRGAGRAELDLNGVVGATIDQVTADGRPVGAASGTTAGAGIQITDSSDVAITNSTTRNNDWGGVALFQTNRFFDQQTTNITVATGNTFNESNPLYLQDESASKNFGTLNLPGFSYAVRNTASVGSGSSLVDYSQFTWMQAAPQGAFNLAVNLLAPDASYIQGWSGTALTQTFHVGVGALAAGGSRNMSIMTAVDRADPGAAVSIYPGSYTETAMNRTIPGVGGTYNLGLYVNKDGLTLRGVDAAGSAIANADNVQAWITAGAITNFGMAHGVSANSVTFEGLGFKPKPDSLNKTIEIAGDNFTFRNSVVDNRPSPGGTTETGGAGALYFGELDPAGHPMTRLAVTGSKFYDGSVSIQNGVGVDGVTYAPAPQRVISGNRFIGSSNYRFGGVLLTGKMDEIPWRPMPIASVTVTGNSFSGFDDAVLVRGDQQGVDLRQVMRDNSFERSVLVTDAAGNARGETYRSTPDGVHFTPRQKYSIQSSIGAGLNRSVTGDTVAVGPGTYAESVVLNGPRNLTFNGSTIQGLTLNPGAAGSGIGGNVTANTAAGFTFNAPVVLLSDTTLATTGGNIVLNGDLQTAGGSPFGLSLMAGGGNVFIASGGTSAHPLGQFNSSSDDFSLSGTLWVSGFNIGASGNVALSDHSLHATQTGLLNLIAAGGSSTGSVFSESPLIVDAGGSIEMKIDATFAVVTSPGVIQVVNVGDTPIEVNGKLKAPVVNVVPSRLMPAESTISGNLAANSTTRDASPAVVAPNSLPPSFAGEALDQGRSVEIDLAPGYGRRR